MKRLRFKLFFFIAGILMLCSSFVIAGGVPPKIEAVFILKIFSLDTAIASRADDNVNIGILYVAENSDSVAQKDKVKANLSAMSGKKLAGKPINIVEIPYTDRAVLEGSLSNIAILYVTVGNEGNVTDIRAACDAKQTRSFASSRDMIENGIAVGVVLNGGKPKILINKSASSSCGARFSPALMRLAEVI